MGGSSSQLGGFQQDYEIAQEVADGLMEARVRPEHLQKGLQKMVKHLQQKTMNDRERLRIRLVLDALCERAKKRADFKALLEDPVCALYANHPDVEDLKQSIKEERDLRQGRTTQQM